MPEPRPDRELVDRWREGDADAGDELFGRHFEALYRFFRNKIDGPVDDLVQATFLACADSRERFRGASTFRTFAFAIARRVLFDHLRERYALGDKADPSERSVADLGTSPSQFVAKRREQRLLLHALRHLRLDYQIALELSFWEELSGPEIGEVLGVPEATARTWLRRAKIELAERVSELAGREPLPSTRSDLSEWAASLRSQVDPEGHS